jgi:hypothetical protein
MKIGACATNSDCSRFESLRTRETSAARARLYANKSLRSQRRGKSELCSVALAGGGHEAAVLKVNGPATAVPHEPFNFAIEAMSTFKFLK